jgi:hypothetical protein
MCKTYEKFSKCILRWPYRLRFFICKRWAFQKAKRPLLSAFRFLKHWPIFFSPWYPLGITGKKRNFFISGQYLCWVTPSAGRSPSKWPQALPYTQITHYENGWMMVQKDAGNDGGKSVWVHMCKLYKMCVMLDAMQLPSTRITKSQGIVV